MFTIIGGDGKEYGPVTADQIRAWITDGRANLETRAKALGTEEWRRLGDFAEFGATTGFAPPPPMPAPEPARFRPTPTGELIKPLAGRGERLLAQLLDNVIAIICVLPGALMIGFAAARAGLKGVPDDLTSIAGFGAGALAIGLGFVLLLGVQIWLLCTRGQTIGKMALDVKIVRFADNAPPGFLHAVLLRLIVPGIIGVIPWVGLLFTLVNYCFIFGQSRRCLHDLIAGTKVVKA